jgi:transposase
MFWGCFSKQGLGPLVVIDGTLSAENYKNLLEEYLLPEIHSCNVPMTFMQDNAPCHKAKPVLEFFESNGITTLDWPPQSPDLNPIENLWSIIKQKRAKKFGIPTSKKELIKQIFEI